MLLLLETYSNWSFSNREFSNSDLNISEPYLNEGNIYFDDFKFYKLSLYLSMSTLSFLTIIYILTQCYCIYKKCESISLIQIGKTVTLAHTSLFLLFPSLIWDLSVHEYHIQFIFVYTTLSQLLAYRGKIFDLYNK